jgi:hypothetical protein
MGQLQNALPAREHSAFTGDESFTVLSPAMKVLARPSQN